MKELRSLIPTALTPTEGIGVKVVPKPTVPQVPQLQPIQSLPSSGQVSSGKKTVVLAPPGQESITAPQSPPNQSGAMWPFPSKENASKAPPVPSNVIPELRPLRAKPDAAPKLTPIVRSGVIMNPPVPATNTDPSPCAEVQIAPAVQCTLVVPDEYIAPVFPELVAISKPKVEVVHEIPALAAVIKNDEMFVIFGVNAQGESEYKGMFTKSKLQEYSGENIHKKACTLLTQMYATQAGTADWVARKGLGHCTPSASEITRPNGTNIIAKLHVVDDGRDRGMAMWEEETSGAQSEITYTFVIFKAKMNELGVSVPLVLTE